MNIIKQLGKDIDNNEWDLYTKARYLYLKSCEFFTYDYRYYYGDVNLTRELFNKQIDLENVTDNRVICGTWATQVYLPLLELIGIKGKLVGVDGGHQYVKFLIDDREIRADACGISDLARVKFKNSTAGFCPNCKHYDCGKILEMDKKIGYIDNEYSSSFIEQEIKILEEEFYNTVDSPILPYNDEFLIFKLYKIKDMLESFPKLKEFGDCQFFIDYLRSKMLDNYEATKVNKTCLYNPDLPNWNFINLYSVNLNTYSLYFILANNENGYSFYEIMEDEAINYCSKSKKIVRL